MANCSHSSLMVNLPLLARVTNFNLCSGVGVVFQGIGALKSVTHAPGQSVTNVPGSYPHSFEEGELGVGSVFGRVHDV